MHFAILSLDGLLFIVRWLHVFFGIVWIGHLYYFNFVQGAFFAETDAATKSNAIQKLVPRALWWFRYGALYTMVTGLILIGAYAHQMGGAFFATSNGITITIGAVLGLIMGANVWFVIWPKQKIVIASATDAAAGRPANPAAGAAGTQAGLASRHNVLFSIPLLFFMLAARHLPIAVNETANLGALYGVAFLIIAALELNGLKGKLGPLTKVSGVVHMGFLLSALLYVVVEVFA